jgi:hypothetical protein
VVGVTVLADHHRGAARQLAGPVEGRFDGLRVVLSGFGRLQHPA